jgi:hypothetical protein
MTGPCPYSGDGYVELVPAITGLYGYQYTAWEWSIYECVHAYIG